MLTFDTANKNTNKMRKISTLYKKDPSDLGRVINEVTPENLWVFETGIPTRKFDGSACMILNGELYRRYDAKHGKKAPENAIPCQEADLITGHHPHWIKCDRKDKSSKYYFEAFDCLENKSDGTYEAIGEKFQGNPEHITGHKLIKHGVDVLHVSDFSFEGLRNYLSNPDNDIEGIVFHDMVSDKMCKIRKKDFGIKR